MNYTPFDEAVVIGAEFWNLLGGSSIYQELLALYEEVGREYEETILNFFQR